MTAYRVTIHQSIKRDGDWIDGTFTEYVLTMLKVSYIVKRFEGCETEAESDFRHVRRIEIETIHIQEN